MPPSQGDSGKNPALGTTRGPEVNFEGRGPKMVYAVHFNTDILYQTQINSYFKPFPWDHVVSVSEPIS